MPRNRKPQGIKRVRKLRREMGVSEKILWEKIKDRRIGFYFRTQHPIDTFALDFYCAEARLCVELDGEMHELRLDRDAARDEHLSKQGIKTLRIKTSQLFDDFPVEELIWAECYRRVFGVEPSAVGAVCPAKAEW